MPRLTELFSRAGVKPDRIEGDPEVRGICEDTRILKAGELFVCMPSASGDSHRFVPEAKAKGASGALAHSESGFQMALDSGLAAVLILNDDLKFSEGIWRLAKESFANPSAKLRVIGITGTNGKTTTAWLIRDALNALNHKAAYLGTLGIQTPKSSRELSNTTPFAIETQRLLCECVVDGAQALSMEVSSHALKERRADGIEFDAAVFTNLTQDHLDYHPSMEDYADAKLRLFTELPKQTKKPFRAAINVDDETGRLWIAKISVPVITFGFKGGDLLGRAIDVKVDGLTMALNCKGKEVELRSHLGGQFNVQNCLSAAAGLIALGHSIEDAAKGLASARPVPGRFEAVLNDKGIGILIDYAHTPDALEKLLTSVRALNPKKLITVFGCGGDRDRNKRPKMAAVVSRLSDLSVVTSDNPRTEKPEAIIREVESGIAKGSDSISIVDRREAVANAIQKAKPGDVVVIAGKGHENYQIIGRTKHPMDDRELARDALKKLGAAK